MSDNLVTPHPVKHRPARWPALVAIALAIAGAALQSWGFINGIVAALESPERGIRIYELVFFVGSGLVLAAIAMSVVALVRRARGVWIVALLISLLPVAAVITIAIAARA